MGFATIVSRVFEPLVILIILTLLGAVHAGLTGAVLIRFFLFFITLIVSPIALFRLWLVKKGVHWNIPKRPNRIVPLFMLLGFQSVAYIFVRLFWNTSELTKLFGLFLVWLIGFFLLTLKTKVSAHVGVATVAALLLYQWFGSSWRPVLLIIPLVAWARVVTKNHTVAQVVMGAVYSCGILLLFTSQIVNR